MGEIENAANIGGGAIGKFDDVGKIGKTEK